jgi:hypothetical protein
MLGNVVGKVFGNGGKLLGNGGSVLGNGNGNGNVLRPASATGGVPASAGRATVGPVLGVPGLGVVRPGVTGTTVGFGRARVGEAGSTSALTVVSGAGVSITSGGALKLC